MKSKGKGLGQSIKDFAKNVVIEVDPFNYAELIHENARVFAKKQAKERQVNPDEISLTIHKKKEAALEAALYVEKEYSRKITIEELIQFFIGYQDPTRSNIQVKVSKGVESFIHDYSQKWNLSSEDLTFQIFTTKDQIHLESFFKGGKIGIIKIKSLIKYFN